MKRIIPAAKRFLGINANRTSHQEKLISGLGGFVGILLILLVTHQFVAAVDATLIVASMGASAVLVFAVPHGPLSQPWAVLGGHLISAFIGVSCYLFIPNLFIAAASAVGLSITAMYYLRCIHPPGGATALTAVVAGPGLHALGYYYMLTPVLLNVLIILNVALLFNYPFEWRRYPTALMHFKSPGASATEQTKEETLSREDFEYAISQMDLYVDIGHAEVEQIYQLALARKNQPLDKEIIKLGHYYSNGEFGSNWSVRQVIDESVEPKPGEQLIYKVVAGKDRRRTGTASREHFAAWAKYEVYLNENSWHRVNPEDE